jgi:CYTH domain-containing protein
MPIEHELKFVLNDSANVLFDQLNAQHDCHHLEQFYMRDGARFRSTNVLTPQGKLVGNPEYIFCYKNKIYDKVLEIEVPVSEDDYELAMIMAERRLNKLRFKIEVPEGLWDIDYFLTAADDGDPSSQLVYFIMAEFEHEPNAKVEVLDVLKPFVSLAVPHKYTNAFSSRKLCDADYARRVVGDYHSSRLSWY